MAAQREEAPGPLSAAVLSVDNVCPIFVCAQTVGEHNKVCRASKI